MWHFKRDLYMLQGNKAISVVGFSVTASLLTTYTHTHTHTHTHTRTPGVPEPPAVSPLGVCCRSWRVCRTHLPAACCDGHAGRCKCVRGVSGEGMCKQVLLTACAFKLSLPLTGSTCGMNRFDHLHIALPQGQEQCNE